MGWFARQKFIGTKRRAWEGTNTRSSVILTDMANRKQFVLCVRNNGYEASLERRKIYQLLSDRDAAAHGQLRVIDESGEDYVYPEEFFVSITLPRPLRRAILAAV